MGAQCWALALAERTGIRLAYSVYIIRTTHVGMLWRWLALVDEGMAE